MERGRPGGTEGRLMVSKEERFTLDTSSSPGRRDRGDHSAGQGKKVLVFKMKRERTTSFERAPTDVHVSQGG